MTREKVCQLHDLGYHCSQTVLWHTSQVLGVDRDLMLRLSSGMGGGAGAGSLCGAANAAIATLGIAFGFSEPNAREQNARLALEVADYAYVLQRGKLLMENAARELKHDKRIIYA